MDQLVSLANDAEDKQKIALIDLMRLIVLDDKQAEYIVNKHWELAEVSIMGYLECQDLQSMSAEAKVTHNYHLVCLKFLTNLYQTSSGR